MSIASAAPSPHLAGPDPADPAQVAERSRQPATGSPRVRQQARDAAALMVFSAATSAAVAVFFLLLAVAARQA